MTCTAKRHGTTTAYRLDGCRCPNAKEAQARYRKQLRWRHHRGLPPRVDATGTRRRIEALMVSGWPRHEILRAAGYSDSGTWLFAAKRVHTATAARISDVYERLVDTPGPSRWTATWATNRGYVPPIAWDDDTIDDPQARPWAGASPTTSTRSTIVDEIAVERALRGEPVNLTTAERVEVVRRLTERGFSVTSIAHALRMSGSRTRELLQRAGVAS